MSTTVPDIRIPEAIRPQDGRFGCGPSKVRPEAVEALAAAGAGPLGTSHRQRPVRDLVGRARAGVAELMQLPDGYEVMLGNGGATLFWDAATFNLIEARSQHLSFGEFSSKFAAAAAAAPHIGEAEVIESEPGDHPEPRPNPGVDAYCLTHNETSTGVAMEVRRPAADGLVLVDGTSAVGGLRLDPTQFDAYYFSPQKCLGSEGGTWLAACSPRALERIERLRAERWTPASLDLALALDNARKDQTYNTPSVGTLILLVDQLDWIAANGGIEWAAGRADASAAIIYGWAGASEYATPFVADPAKRSHTVATIDLDERVPATTVSQVLRANGIVDTESYRKLGRNQLRVALFPTIDPEDVRALTACVDHVVAALTA